MLQSNKKFNPIYVAHNIVRLKRYNNLIQRNPTIRQLSTLATVLKVWRRNPQCIMGNPSCALCERAVIKGRGVRSETHSFLLPRNKGSCCAEPSTANQEYLHMFKPADLWPLCIATYLQQKQSLQLCKVQPHDKGNHSVRIRVMWPFWQKFKCI